MPFENNGDRRSWVAFSAIVYGTVLGVIAEFAALVVTIASAGAGHGDYVLARALFPFSMLLTLVEGSIGTLSMMVGLVQFPIYGALLVWAFVRKAWLPAVAMVLLHLAAAITCFSGVLPYLS